MQRAGGPRRRRGVELRPGRARAYPGAAAASAAPPDGRRVAVGHPEARHGHAAVCALFRSPVNSNVSPSHSPPARSDPGRVRSHSAPALVTVLPAAGAGTRDNPQRASARRYCLPAATASCPPHGACPHRGRTGRRSSRSVTLAAGGSTARKYRNRSGRRWIGGDATGR